jgi:hypothetical protein
MTRKEYTDRLKSALHGFDDEAASDIILEIDDHIDELIQKHPGKSEDDIVASLDSPEILAASLMREAGIPEENSGDGEEREEKKKISRTITIDGEDLAETIQKAFEIARMFKYGRRKNGRHEDTGKTSGPGGLGGPGEINFPAKDVKDITVRQKSNEIIVKLSLGNVRVEFDDDPDVSMDFRLEPSGKLVIRSNGNEEPDRLTLWVPSTVRSLSISTASGDIKVLDRMGDIDLHSASGDIEVNSCSGNVSVSTASGDVELEGCQEDISVNTASGSIVLRADSQMNSAKLESVSGDVTIAYPEDFDSQILVKTLSGDVSLEGRDYPGKRLVLGDGTILMAITTVSGDIEVTHA